MSQGSQNLELKECETSKGLRPILNGFIFKEANKEEKSQEILKLEGYKAKI